MLDLIVAGGGPAGLATAMEARLRGLSVQVREPREAAIDKACGEGLMPAAVRALERLGVEIPRSHRFEGVRYVDGDCAAAGRFGSGPAWACGGRCCTPPWTPGPRRSAWRWCTSVSPT